VPVWPRRRSGKRRDISQGMGNIRAADHFIAASHKDRDSTCVSAFFNNEHLVTCCTKGHFSDYTRLAQLFGRQVLKARNYAALSSYCDELRIPSAKHPQSVLIWDLTSISGPPTHRTAGR
jgi:hypothetical protein